MKLPTKYYSLSHGATAADQAPFSPHVRFEVAVSNPTVQLTVTDAE